MRHVSHRVPVDVLLVALLSLGSAAAGAAEFRSIATASSQTATRNAEQIGEWKTGGSSVWSTAEAVLLDQSPSLVQNAEARSSATATFGHLTFVSRTGTTQTSVSGVQPGTRAESMASVEGADSFVISCLTCVDGTRGVMNFRVVLEGDVGMGHASTDTTTGQPIPGPDREMSYFWSANLTMRASGVAMDFPGPGWVSQYGYDYLAMVNDRVVAGGSREGLGVYDLQLEFEFGRPIEMLWQGTAMSSSFLHDSADPVIGFLSAQSRAAFTNSFYWDGISSVTDADGNAVSGFTALNSAGVNYAQSFADVVVAVPEPGMGALTLGGLVLLATLARRRRVPSP